MAPPGGIRPGPFSFRSRTIAAALLLAGLAATAAALEPTSALAHYGYDVWDSDSGLPRTRSPPFFRAATGTSGWAPRRPRPLRRRALRVFDTRTGRARRRLHSGSVSDAQRGHLDRERGRPRAVPGGDFRAHVVRRHVREPARFRDPRGLGRCPLDRIARRDLTHFRRWKTCHEVLEARGGEPPRQCIAELPEEDVVRRRPQPSPVSQRSLPPMGETGLAGGSSRSLPTSRAGCGSERTRGCSGSTQEGAGVPPSGRRTRHPDHHPARAGTLWVGTSAACIAARGTDHRVQS